MISVVAVYASHITRLELNKIIHINVGPDTAGLDLCVFGPYLAAFANLEALQLHSFELTHSQPSDWPQPSFQLTSLSLSVTFGFGFRPLQPSDLAWFTSSSRHSLRHLSLEGYTHDALAEVAEWDVDLRTLELVFWAEGAAGQGEMLVKLAGRKELERLEMVHALGDAAGLRPVAADVNGRVGRRWRWSSEVRFRLDSVRPQLY